MNMTDFWEVTHSQMSEPELRQTHPQAFAAFDADDAKQEITDWEFAFAGIPNIEPSGATTQADEEDLDERDPDQEITDPDGPSLGGEIALMAYSAQIDELFVWDSEDSKWHLWNY